MAPSMAFIGLGQMGQAMSRNLASKASLTSPLLLFNRSTQVTHDHVSALNSESGSSSPSVEAAASVPDAVARSDIVWSCLADEEAVNEVFEQIHAGAGGAVEVKGKLFVECSTVPPGATAKVARKVEENGGMFVAMPVFGEPATAAAGNLIVVPAGPAEAVERVRPYLEGCLAGAVIDLSDEDQSKGQLLKIIGNVLIMTAIEQVSELMVLSEKTGLGVDNLRKLFAAMYPGGPIKQHLLYSGHMASGEWSKRVPIVTVDAAIALTDKVSAMAKAHGVELKSYDVARQHLRDARDQGSGKLDILAIYGAVRAEAGLKFKQE